MATASPTLHLQMLLIVLLLLPCFPKLSHAGSNIAVYWGQNVSESSLAEACKSGNYGIVMIAFLNQFGQRRRPVLDLSGHCNSQSPGDCHRFTKEIQECQSNHVKVLLSIGGAGGNYSLKNRDDAHWVAEYIYNHYLGGRSTNRPLGNAILDGVDFDIEKKGMWWGSLAKRLSEYSNIGRRKVILSAAPQCPRNPVNILGKAINTGVFDYVWVQFYNNPECQYATRHTARLLKSWKTWASSLTNNNATKLFLGLPAARKAATSGGYIPREVLTGTVLPAIKKNPKYGGVMLWNRYFDINNRNGRAYSDAFKSIA